MQSPFPGMDPFIEGCGLWEDFHKHLIEKISEVLADTCPERYVVRTGERSYLVLVEAEGKVSHPFVPDVSIAAPTGRKRSPKKGGVAVVDSSPDDEPLTLRAFIDHEYHESFVEIYETDPEHRLVTCIEVLSPSNKRTNTPGWDVYQRKRQNLLLGEAHLVELDLLRGGTRMPMLDPWPQSPYVFMVAKARDPQRCKVWSGHLDRPLPALPIPLAKPDPPIRLDVQPIVEGIYRRHRYARSIDYARPISPALKPKEVAWLQERVKVRAKS